MLAPEFKTTNEDLKVGDLIRIWYNDFTATGFEAVSELAVVVRYYRPNVSVRGYWLFWNNKRGEFSHEYDRVELVSRT
jgi:hypothetical protein